MKRTIYLAMGVGVAAIVTLLLSLWSGSSVVVPQVLASSHCSLATLTGSYAALYQGYNVGLPEGTRGQPGFGPYIGFAAVIVVRFDGKGEIGSTSGGVSALQLGTANRFFDVTSGFYSLESDCTGTLTFFDNRGVTFQHRIHVAGNGEEYRFLRLQNVGFPVELIQFGTARRMELAP